LKTLIQNRSNL